MSIHEQIASRFLTAQGGVIYTAVFLTESSKQTLRRWWTNELGLDLLDQEYMHHMTIEFRPDSQDAFALDLGSQTTLEVMGYAADDKGQAVAVRSEVFSTNDVPHITVSTASGTSPVYSNDLLARQKKRKKGPVLVGTVGYYDGNVQFS